MIKTIEKRIELSDDKFALIKKIMSIVAFAAICLSLIFILIGLVPFRGRSMNVILSANNLLEFVNIGRNSFLYTASCVVFSVFYFYVAVRILIDIIICLKNIKKWFSDPVMFKIDGEIVTSKIANRSVTTEKIADNAVTCNQISMTGEKRIATANLQDSVITNSKLADGSVNAVKIATSGVATHNYQDYSVTEQKLASSAVTTPKIKNQAVTKEKIAPGAVDLECLGPNISDIINRAVVHDGQGNVTGEGKSTILNDITATGDIYARRVYNVVYMDIAEGYIPGEELKPGDANESIDKSSSDCAKFILSVLSDSFMFLLCTISFKIVTD